MKQMVKPLYLLGVFDLTMMTVVSVDNVRNLPSTAYFGGQLLLFFLLATACFLIPCALTAAELSSNETEEGGLYAWVKRAFGQRVGFAAVYFQWAQNLAWYPTILAFISATGAYLINPQWVDHPAYIVASILVVFWFATLWHVRGMKASIQLSNFCSVAGLLIPMGCIIVLGIVWYCLGNPVQIHVSLGQSEAALTHMQNWASLTAIMLAFLGMELSMVHSRFVRNPRRDFPRAMLYASIIIAATILLSSLSIASVVPHDKINLTTGIMQAYAVFFSHFNLSAFTPVLGVMMIFGALGGLSNWIIAPVRGMQVAAKDLGMLGMLKEENSAGVPVKFLIMQGVLVSVISLAFFFLPSVKAAYWYLSVLVSQLYMFVYILMFAALFAIRLKQRKSKETMTGFQIPGGFMGASLVVILGLLSTLVTLGVGFVPPEGVNIGHLWSYEAKVLLGLLLLIFPPLLSNVFKRNKTK